MLNLLRPEQKKKIIHEYRVRFFVLLFSLLFFAQLIAIILLFPSYATSKAHFDSVNSQTAILQAQNVTEEVATLNTLIKKTNDYVDVSLSKSIPKNITSAINIVVDNRGAKVKINGLIYNAIDGKQQIVVQGVAATRQDLLDFVQKLKQQKGVSAADLPISDFSQPQNINFSLTVTITPQNNEI